MKFGLKFVALIFICDVGFRVSATLCATDPDLLQEMNHGRQLPKRRLLHVRLRSMHEGTGSALLHAPTDRWMPSGLLATEAIEAMI